MKKPNFKFFLFFFIPFLSLGQIRCAISNVASNSLKLRHSRLNLKIQEHFQKTQLADNYTDELIKIPIVVHVIHNKANNQIGGEDNPNISDDQIFSQIKVLNEDYRRKQGTLGFNTNSVGSDLNIEFYLAEKDPNGNPSSGINRIFNSKPNYDVFDDNYLLSGLSYWDSSKYLNIWVTTLSGGYLGYGEFPGGEFDGLDTEDVDEKIDGVIIDHRSFGKKIGTSKTGIYSFGRTLSHEIGHWFGLIHTWGDEFCGDDYCADTPWTEKGNSSSLCQITFSRCKGQRTQNMIENYMDYSPDSCMNIFTNDQKTRIRAILEVSKRRKRIITNSKFNLPNSETLAVKVLENPTNKDFHEVQVLVNGFSNYGFILYDALGRPISSSTFQDSPSRLLRFAQTDIGKGIFVLKVFNEQEAVTKKLIFP